MLEELPWELLYQICDWLMRDDVQMLALTCRVIARRTKPYRFRSIRIMDVSLGILRTLQSDPEIADAVREVIFDFPGEFDPYTPQVSDETLSKYIQHIFSHLVDLSAVAWTSPRAPSDAILDVVATRGICNISFSQQQRWHNIDTVLRKTLCEMKLDSFCHVQAEKAPKLISLINASPRADLKELSLSHTPAWIEPPHEPLDLERIILSHLDNETKLLPTILNSRHLTCIMLHVQNILNAESLTQWLEGSPVYPSLRTFSFAVKTEHWEIAEILFMSTKLLPFLSKHPSLTYLDINLYADGNFEAFAAILREMKMLEFFGFATKVGSDWDHPNHGNIFEYLLPLLSALPSRLGGLEIGTWYWLTSPEEDRLAHYRALAQQFPYLNYFLISPITTNSHRAAKEYPQEARVIAEEMKCLEWIQGGHWTYRIIRQDPNAWDTRREVKNVVLWGKQVRHPWNPKEPRKSKLFEEIAAVC